jgi:hypothetical protein
MHMLGQFLSIKSNLITHGIVDVSYDTLSITQPLAERLCVCFMPLA